MLHYENRAVTTGGGNRQQHWLAPWARAEQAFFLLFLFLGAFTNGVYFFFSWGVRVSCTKYSARTFAESEPWHFIALYIGTSLLLTRVYSTALVLSPQ